MSQASGHTTPHPTIILTNRLIRHYEHRHKTAMPTMRAILMISGYNHNKHLKQQHVPRKIMEKLPRVTPA